MEKLWKKIKTTFILLRVYILMFGCILSFVLIFSIDLSNFDNKFFNREIEFWPVISSLATFYAVLVALIAVSANNKNFLDQLEAENIPYVTVYGQIGIADSEKGIEWKNSGYSFDELMLEKLNEHRFIKFKNTGKGSAINIYSYILLPNGDRKLLTNSKTKAIFDLAPAEIYAYTCDWALIRNICMNDTVKIETYFENITLSKKYIVTSILEKFTPDSDQYLVVTEHSMKEIK